MLSTLRRRLLWLTVGRSVVATLILGSAPLIRDSAPGTLGVGPFYALIGFIYALTFAYALTLRFFECHRWLVDMQLALDVAVISGFVYLTGGVGSYLSSLYTLPIIAATTVQSRRSGVTVAVLSCALYAGLVVAQYAHPQLFERVSGLAASLPAVNLGLYTVGLNLLGFAAVAALSGCLAEGLRQAAAQLQRATDQIDVRRVITDAARLLENSAELNAAHKLAVDVPDDEVLFDADESQLRQIVWNLATNGLRAIPDGGRLTLSIRSPAADDQASQEVVIGVRDEGIRIAPEELNGIFQPFRGGFARGSGLGLSIVQRIVAEYGGETQVTSERGAGTFVQVRFPATRRAPEPSLAVGKVE